MIVAGVMTGTSVDAIDVAICRFPTDPTLPFSVELLYYSQTPYSPELQAAVTRALSGESSLEELALLPFDLARAFANSVKSAMNASALVPDVVGVHGQTLWHCPPRATWQSVSGPALSALLGLPVVYDFRSADVALGGQGAPLVPMFDLALFRSSKPRVALNIGGMANVTLLPPDGYHGMVKAFDTGPGNILINSICRLSFGKQFDEDGKIAASGIVLERALNELQSMEYFRESPPKSTGREVFGEDLAERMWKRYSHPSIPAEDLVTTVTELTAWSIADHILRYHPETTEVIVSGGGVHNTFLMNRIQSLLSGINVVSSSFYGLNPDAKEAAAFAYLAWLTWHQQPGNLPSVTGATARVVLGSIARATIFD